MNDQVSPSAAQVSKSAEVAQDHNGADPFPPEGTDEKVLMRKTPHVTQIAEKDRVDATRAVIASGLSNDGKGKPD